MARPILKLLHISDLHFGRLSNAMPSFLLSWVKNANVDLILVSGDLTQRARPQQFKDAKTFLLSLGIPYLSVPGNHDTPLYQIFDRFFRPYRRYRKYFDEELEPEYKTNDIQIIGVNSVDPFQIQNGKLSESQFHQLKKRFSKSPNLRVLFSHHPLELLNDRREAEEGPKGIPKRRLFEELHLDLLLSGHHHSSKMSLSSDFYAEPHHAFVVLQSGTTLSSRTRDEVNAFNFIELSADSMRVDVFRVNLEKKAFDLHLTSNFLKNETGWKIVRNK